MQKTELKIKTRTGYIQELNSRIIPVFGHKQLKRPTAEKNKADFYNDQEAEMLIKTLYNEPANWRLYFLGCLIGGFRRGELVALEWHDVDFEENTIRIRQNISVSREGKTYVDTPKTDGSADEVDMPEWYMQEIQKYKEIWEEEHEEINGVAEIKSTYFTNASASLTIRQHQQTGGSSF